MAILDLFLFRKGQKQRQRGKESRSQQQYSKPVLIKELKVCKQNEEMIGDECMLLKIIDQKMMVIINTFVCMNLCEHPKSGSMQSQNQWR